MKSYWLVLNRDEKNKRVAIIDNHSEAVSCQVKQYKISPIFPVSNNYELPDFDKKVYIQFYFVHNPFTTLVEMLRLFSGTDIEKHIWISHGLAAIVYISGDKEEKQSLANLFIGQDTEIEDKLKQNVLAIQEWKLNNTILDPESAILLEPKQPDVKISLRDYSRLPPDLQNDIFEFVNCIKTVIQRSKLYTPNFTNGFESLIYEMNQIITDLEELFRLDSSISETSDKEKDLKINNERLVQINELTEEIVQMNSTLSYVISQGYAGALPIEDNSCLIHAYSLLGVGTAHKAFHTFYRYISNVFSEYSIDTIIEKYYEIPQSPIYSDMKSPYLQEWQKNKQWGIDYYVERESGRNENHNLMVHFSGRQGFSESMFSISAAIQCLYLGMTNRWSIITSTHELMHSHVRGIYSLLQERIDKYQWEEISSFLEEPSRNDLKLIDGISLITLNFARAYLHFKQLELEKTETLSHRQKWGVGVTDKSLLEEINIASYDVVNEIMAHTLDFYYFYQNDPSIYIKQIWLSWAALPTTPLKVQEYVLRSVSAIATLEDDLDTYIRIRNACEKTVGILNELVELDKSINNEIYKAAIKQIIKPAANFEVLLRACLYLADATKCFFHSEKLQIALFEDITKKKIDTNGDIDDGVGLDYALNCGKFEGESITNPVSFILSMVRNTIPECGNQEFENDRYNTLWLYFVCSSLKDEGSDVDVSK